MSIKDKLGKWSIGFIGCIFIGGLAKGIIWDSLFMSFAGEQIPKHWFEKNHYENIVEVYVQNENKNYAPYGKKFIAPAKVERIGNASYEIHCLYLPNKGEVQLVDAIIDGDSYTSVLGENVDKTWQVTLIEDESWKGKKSLLLISVWLFFGFLAYMILFYQNPNQQNSIRGELR